jgi:hypothetical protein
VVTRPGGRHRSRPGGATSLGYRFPDHVVWGHRTRSSGAETSVHSQASVLQAEDVFFEPEGERIARFDADDDGGTFLTYFLISPGQNPQIIQPCK